MKLLAHAQEQLLRSLVKHGVEFVIVGGVAAQIHGWRSATLDLDIAVAVDDRNVARIDAALAEVGAHSRAIGQFGTAFLTSYCRLEIVRKADGVGSYEHWARKASAKKIADDLTAMVAAPEDILRSKEAAGRDKDLAALPQMREDFLRSGAIS